MAEQDSFEMEEQATKGANIKSITMFFVYVIVLSVVGFCEILYVAMLIPAFPDGLIRSVAIAGACATGASAVVLLVGKLHWFSRGKQAFASWCFVAVETIILTMNVLLAVQLHDGHVAPWLAMWAQFYPAAPIVAFVGWGLILFLDRDNVVRAFQREQADRQQQEEIKFSAMVHRAKMKTKHQSLKIITGYLDEIMESQPNLAALHKTADKIYDNILTEISGQHISSRIPESKQSVSHAQTAQQSPLADPTLHTQANQSNGKH